MNQNQNGFYCCLTQKGIYNKQWPKGQQHINYLCLCEKVGEGIWMCVYLCLSFCGYVGVCVGVCVCQGKTGVGLAVTSVRCGDKQDVISSRKWQLVH